MKELVIGSLKSLGLYDTARATRLSLQRNLDALSTLRGKIATLPQRRKMLRFYSQFIGTGDLCFDVGANLGNRTEIFLELGARIVCIEPQQSCLQHLKNLFGQTLDVTLVGKAAGDHEGYADLAVCADAPCISTLVDQWRTEGRFAKQYQWTHTERVRLTTLDALAATYGVPKFCKIDVEGSEEGVLRGLTTPIDFLSFEFTREFFKSAKNCVDHILSNGPHLFQVSIGESMEFLLPNWSDPKAVYEALHTVRDDLLWGDIYAKSV